MLSVESPVMVCYETDDFKVQHSPRGKEKYLTRQDIVERVKGSDF